MTLKTAPFNAAKYLGEPEAQEVFLCDALETCDAGYIAHALGVIVRAHGMTQVAQVAREAGLSRGGRPTRPCRLAAGKSQEC